MDIIRSKVYIIHSEKLERNYWKSDSAISCNSYQNLLPTNKELTKTHELMYAFMDTNNEESYTDCTEDNWHIWLKRSYPLTGDFNLTYIEYEKGFYLDKGTNYFSGLKYLHYYTNIENTTSQLRVDFGYQGIAYYVIYENFVIGDAASGYIFSIGNLIEGNAGDDLRDATLGANGFQFTTYDNDQDTAGGNVGNIYGGGWWYGAGQNVHPTGSASSTIGEGLHWDSITGNSNSVSFIQFKMKII